MVISSVLKRCGPLYLCVVLTLLSLCFSPSIEAFRGVSPPLKDVQSRFHTLSCSLQLNSLSLNLIPWLSSTVIPLSIGFSPSVYTYSISRSASHAILQLSASAPAGVQVDVYLNDNIVEPHPLPSGVTLDLALVAGPDVIKIKLTQGSCYKTYTITLVDTGSDNIPCTAPNVQVEIGGVNLEVIDVHGNHFPLVITPTWDGLHTWFYEAFIPGNHDLTGGTISFTVTGITPKGWFRYAINHGVYLYGNPSGPVTAPLIPGTNLIQLDVLQLYSCGDYIAEYSITIYPCPEVIPTQITSFTLGLSQASSSTVIPLTVAPPYSPSTLPFYVAYEGSTDFTGGQIHFTPSYQGGTFRYSINFGPYVYGTPSGTEIVAPLNPGTNLIQFDVIQPPPCGDYIAEYSITIYPGLPPTPPPVP
jgi:hypothetical protein